ncbi:hypothetical protein BGZ92_003529, partial [Podila epicladia]
MIIQEIPPFRGRRNDALNKLSPYKKVPREQELPRFHKTDTVKSVRSSNSPQEQIPKDAQKKHQSFKDKDGYWLAGLPTQDLEGVGPERGSGRYVLWSDIKRMFPNVSYLEENGARVLFEVDKMYKVISPLLIKYSETPYVVVTKQHELSQLDTRGIIRSNSLRSTGSVRSIASQHSNNDNDSMSKKSSTIITHHHSIPQVTRHYLSYKDLHRTLDSAKLCPRHYFLKTMANMDYHHNMLCFRTNQLGNIPLAKAVQQDLDQMQDQIQALDHYACQMDLFNRSLIALQSSHRQLEFATPRLFVVLPHELDQWNEHDRSTHRFRLYFLCDFNYRDSAKVFLQPSSMSTIPPQHVHLVDHRGYDLARPHEFFGYYGAYALTMLEIAHHGFTHDIFDVPPLATFHILDSPGVTPPLTRHNLTRTNFRPLVHRAIAYLRQLLPGGGGRPWTTWMSVEETRHLRSFLCRTDRFDHGMGGLCRTAYGADALWLCQGHAHTQASVFRFREFVQHHRGVSDLQLGRLSLRIGSRNQAQELVAALQLAKCVHDVSVRFETDPGKEGLGWFMENVARSGVRVLLLDG